MFVFAVLWSMVAHSIASGRAINAIEGLIVTSEDVSGGFRDCGHLDYYGTYNARQPMAIYKATCDHWGEFGAGDFVSIDSLPENASLVWLEEVAAVRELWDGAQDFDTALESFLHPVHYLDESQIVLPQSNSAARKLVWRSEGVAVVAIPKNTLPVLDMMIPRLWKAVLIPYDPLPTRLKSPPSPADKRLHKIVEQLEFNPEVSSILSALSVAQMSFDIRWLTGEASDSSIISRHSFTDDARIAADWLKSKFEGYGASCELMQFLDGFAPNVICRYAAQSPKAPPKGEMGEDKLRVIISAHYDSRGSFGSVRAPGGDDDGSGITQLLAIARAIYKKGVKFNTDVEFIAFAGEEQGLLGSHEYAKQLFEAKADIMVMIQADMLAYHDADEPMQLGLPYGIGSRVADSLVAVTSAIYAPELKVGWTYACCSDHQSFWQYGFTSTQVFERAGPIIDPFYHHSGDVSNRTNYDLDQVHAIAKVTLASLLHTAGFTMEP